MVLTLDSCGGEIERDNLTSCSLVKVEFRMRRTEMGQIIIRNCD
jgi:hypothetical protein